MTPAYYCQKSYWYRMEWVSRAEGPAAWRIAKCTDLLPLEYLSQLYGKKSFSE